MKRIVINTLWTGGLDSTARIVELSRKDVTIQPFYVVDDNRASTRIEIDAMKKITNRLRNDKATVAALKDVIFIRVAEIKANKKIRDAWKILNGKYKVGSQYQFLAEYASENGIVLELGVERGGGKAQTSIHSESKMVRFEDASGANWHIDVSASSEEARLLYENFTFPLWEKDKHQEVEMMNELGCGDIVEMTWFCHSPMRGKPCGHCNPCKDARHYGFGWRLNRANWLLWYIVRPKGVARVILKALRLK